MSRALLGCGTALVTPFRSDGALDEAALAALVRRQVSAGVGFLVPCGSTGEAATMGLDEQVRVVALVAEVVDGRLPVVAGAGGNDTRAVVAKGRALVDAGATHLMHVVPMYNRPQQRGLVQHFTRVADASPLPVLLYNVPGRTACNMRADTTLELAEHPNIIGIKEASGDLAQIDELLRGRPEGFAVLAGDDAWTLPLAALGGDGVVSVVSNVTPGAMTRLTHAALEGHLPAARQLHRTLAPLMQAMFVETNPVPVKVALSLLGLCAPDVRSPLTSIDPIHVPVLEEALRAADHLLDPAEGQV